MKISDTRERILKEALGLFSEYGYDEVSTQQIAAAVGIKAPSLYNHFKSKQAIFDEIAAEASKKYNEFTNTLSVHMHSAEDDGEVFEKITKEELIEKVTQIFLYSIHDEFVSRMRRMMTIEQFRSPELAAAYTKRYVDDIVDYHENIFSHLIKSNTIMGGNPKAFALAYTAPILSLIGICDRQPQKEDECVKMLKNHVALFFDSVNKQAKKNQSEEK